MGVNFGVRAIHLPLIGSPDELRADGYTFRWTNDGLGFEAEKGSMSISMGPYSVLFEGVGYVRYCCDTDYRLPHERDCELA